MFGSCSNSMYRLQRFKALADESADIERGGIAAADAAHHHGRKTDRNPAVPRRSRCRRRTRRIEPAGSRPESAMAFFAGADGEMGVTPWYFQSSGFSPTSETFQPRTSAEIFGGKFEASNNVVYPTPRFACPKPPPQRFDLRAQGPSRSRCRHYNAWSLNVFPPPSSRRRPKSRAEAAAGCRRRHGPRRTPPIAASSARTSRDRTGSARGVVQMAKTISAIGGS